jgi:hypothetical protein
MPKVRKQTARRKATTKRPKNVIDRITDIDIPDGIKICIYGRSGTGKTRLWSTFPKPILAILCSGGSKPGELRSINTPANRKVIKQVVLGNSEELHEIVEWQDTEQKFNTLVLDHVTGLNDVLLAEVLGLDEPVAQNSWGLATQQQYGQVSLQIKTHLKRMLSLSANVVIVGQEREFNNDEQSQLISPYVGAALGPSAFGWLGPACDYVAQTYIKPVTEEKVTTVGSEEITEEVFTGDAEYCLRTGTDAVYSTKFRVPPGTDLPHHIVDPTFTKIKKLIG